GGARRGGPLGALTSSSDPPAPLTRGARRPPLVLHPQVSPPMSLTTGYDNYDIYGTAKSVVDPNGVETTKLTDAKGRTTNVTSKQPPSDPAEPPDYTTSYTFDSRDRLTDVTLPRVNKLHYEYEDGTNRLTDTIRLDSSGNQQERLHLTLNVIGDKTMEEAQVCASPDPTCSGGWTTKRSDSFSYDTHNRLSSVVHPDTTHVDYLYDSRGNLKS